MTTKRKKKPPYNWRRVDAACRQTPGVWLQLPADLPLLNPSRLDRDDRYVGAFEAPAHSR